MFSLRRTFTCHSLIRFVLSKFRFFPFKGMKMKTKNDHEILRDFPTVLGKLQTFIAENSIFSHCAVLNNIVAFVMAYNYSVDGLKSIYHCFYMLMNNNIETKRYLLVALCEAIRTLCNTGIFLMLLI